MISVTFAHLLHSEHNFLLAIMARVVRHTSRILQINKTHWSHSAGMDALVLRNKWLCNALDHIGRHDEAFECWERSHYIFANQTARLAVLKALPLAMLKLGASSSVARSLTGAVLLAY